MNPTETPDAAADKAIVYVVDDDDAMRRGMQFLLNSAGYRNEGFGSAQEFLDFCTPGLRGCLLLDVRMPGMSGLELQAHLRERQIQLPIVIVTAFANVPMAVRAIQDGAFDFIEKPFRGEELIDRIRRALASDRTRRRDEGFLQHVRERMDTLTPREREVMDLVIAGKLNKEIASDLDISMKTVETHRAAVMRKMGAQSLAELVRMALAVEGD